MQTETKIVFLKDAGLWPDNRLKLSEQLREQFLIERPSYVDKNLFLQKSKGTQQKREWLSYSEPTGSRLIMTASTTVLDFFSSNCWEQIGHFYKLKSRKKALFFIVYDDLAVSIVLEFAHV